MPSYLLGPPPACGYDAIPNFHTVLLHCCLALQSFAFDLLELVLSTAVLSRGKGIDE